MVIFHFEEAGNWNRACCHNNIKNVYHLVYFIGCNIPAKFQEHRFIIGGDILNFVSHHCTYATDDVISD